MRFDGYMGSDRDVHRDLTDSLFVKLMHSSIVLLVVGFQIFCCEILFGGRDGEKGILVSWDRRGSWDLVTGRQFTGMPEMMLFDDGTFIFTRFDRSSEKVLIRMRTITEQRMTEIREFLLRYLVDTRTNEWDSAEEKTDDVPLTIVRVQISGQSKVANVYGLDSDMNEESSKEPALKISELPSSVLGLHKLLEEFKSEESQEYVPQAILLFIRDVEEEYIKNYRGRSIADWNLSPSLRAMVSDAKMLRDRMGVVKVKGKEKAILTEYLQDKIPFSKRENQFLFRSDGKFYELSYRPVLPNEIEED